MMKHYVRLACFVGGALFGSVGVKLLASKDAKKAYTCLLYTSDAADEL